MKWITENLSKEVNAEGFRNIVTLIVHLLPLQLHPFQVFINTQDITKRIVDYFALNIFLFQQIKVEKRFEINYEFFSLILFQINFLSSTNKKIEV